ncbi:hypothetical protein VM1G_09453 [Cytospora mali]|uniref:Uncharacterized protein n=1 Tax=Cytospora mali TaxID=578113 RepID=A0A194WBW2_CYTMA|nr:hypothetical protein VM1G_09453 [Valsa mali]
MDGDLVAANTAALAGVLHSSQSATDFLRDVPAAHDELEPVLLELFNLEGILERSQDVALPVPLFAPLAGVIRGCTEICGRIDGVLSRCGDDTLRSGRWVTTEASVNVRRLRKVLEFCRRTVKLALEATDPDSDQPTLSDIDHLRQWLTSGSLRLTRLGTLLNNCLDEVENFLVHNNHTSVRLEALPSNLPLEHSLTTPSIQSMMDSFKKLATDSPKSTKKSRPSSTASEMESVSETSLHSPLATIPDEDLSIASDSEQRRTKNSPLKLSQRKPPTKDVRPLPVYSLFPSPPPVKSLPPLPPPKSHLRQNPLSGPSNLAPLVPVKSRARTVSDATCDSKSPSLSEAPSNRYSTTSTLSQTKLPPRSSSYADEQPLTSLKHTISAASEDIGVDITPLTRLDPIDKDSAYGVYSIDTSPKSTNLASRHGKCNVNIWEIQSGYSLISTIKVPCYVQAQPRSRDNFIRSHAILSEALNLVAISSGFGHTLEIWDWAKRKKVQSISDTYRWAYARQAQAGSYPLATYREDADTIDLYPASPSPTSKKPFGKPHSIDLKRAGLPHLPKLPELAYSATGPLLVAAAGPRPPRPNCPPPEHAAMLMAWQLDDNTSTPTQHRPYKFLMPSRTRFPELENSLPLCLATYGSVAVSIWSTAKFRTIGGPGAWQVEPVVITERTVLVWDFGADDETTAYRIPDVLSCAKWTVVSEKWMVVIVGE